ncbi:PREDICTED: agamous-like MADS-box protein AGL62 [Camelina sativa]|uniref:Agamous-like MADS-box protein AGL62 n=1 Tax=Camelina sativa TaxID=90675 RepID=A0ABM0T6M5_CAMSA|nr:PREDICTED: agamous-like MADS-box protein AGL62 [Camelina sativa]
MVRSNKGRQKIEMKKIKNESNLQVTFSKRRFGLFKKASELCTLCGAEILMIVFSPGGKAFSFGHPGVKELIHRFLNVNHNSLIPHQPNYNQQLAESCLDRNIQYLNEMLTQVLARQEKAKHNRMALDMVRQSREERGKSWYEKDVKELDLNETDNLICALQDVKKKVVSEMSDYPQLNVSHQSYMGETFVFGGGRNVDVGGIDLFDQRVNTFSYNPVMDFPYQTPFFGYNNDGVIVPGYNMNYMSSHNFNGRY